MLKSKIMPSCYSEIDTLTEVILCSPANIDVQSSEVSSVGFVNELKSRIAIEQHNNLKQKLADFGCVVHDISSENNEELWNRLVNRIFVRDIAAAFGNKLILGLSDTEIRRPDFRYTHKFLNEMVDSKHITNVPNSVSFEFGDFMIINRQCVLINTGHRTNNIEYLTEFLYNMGIEEVGFISLPQTIEALHLDVVCNILGENHLLAAPFLKFMPVSIYRNTNIKGGEVEYVSFDQFAKRHGYSVCWLPNKSYLIDYTNFINLDKKTALVSQAVVSLYEEWFPNMKFIGVDVSHLQNGAGSIRCLTLPISREEN
ncbi:arginine deiminase family protein [Bacillus cereus]|uniref:arginine deiminase family protein n=1 Tax=Bacillus cereus TaxID=1396 RepID=UPI001248C8E5|nr:hypothetical protein [Bacillus cereus]MCU5475469.1 arginine deiminase family protein [Bacillus cereus]MCU5614904.1 arginine deiminase family protein [Bacillus cereus]